MKEAKRKLEDELRKLGRELKEEIPRALKTAADMGDLSENAEYQAAKERQSFLQARLAQLRHSLVTPTEQSNAGEGASQLAARAIMERL